jgi:hypothetical protein
VTSPPASDFAIASTAAGIEQIDFLRVHSGGFVV